MGFRDLRNFNLAMLAKQGWRLMQEEGSLVYGCFKAKYFPRGCFLEASDVPNSSFVWKSLLAAQALLKKGSCWRVGNGSSIRIMQDKWIPNHPTNQVLQHPIDVDGEGRVNMLIDETVHEWDRDSIREKFSRDDAETILRIPLSRRDVSDTMVWLPNKNGIYSVKSRYYIARLLAKEMNGMEGSSDGQNRGLIWSRLWKLRLPNKIKLFGWRACHNILPTKDNLARRRIIVDSACELCNQRSESSLHVLWECGVARDVWAGSKGRLQKSVCGQTDFSHLFVNLMDRLSREELESFLVQCWLIWNQRNFVLHGGTLQDPSRLIQRAADLLDEFNEAQGQLAISSLFRPVQQWEPPVGLSYKVNVDATLFADIRASGFGVVVRNERAEVMAALTTRGPPVQDSEEAEVLACRRALEFAVDAGFMDVVLEGDNLCVMKSIATGSANRSRLGHIYEDIQCLATGLRSFSVNFVKRSANTVAHALGRFARNVDDELRLLQLLKPPPALEALYFDSLRFNQ